MCSLPMFSVIDTKLSFNLATCLVASESIQQTSVIGSANVALKTVRVIVNEVFPPVLGGSFKYTRNPFFGS